MSASNHPPINQGNSMSDEQNTPSAWSRARAALRKLAAVFALHPAPYDELAGLAFVDLAADETPALILAELRGLRVDLRARQGGVEICAVDVQRDGIVSQPHSAGIAKANARSPPSASRSTRSPAAVPAGPS